jgi:hypothetical protein
LLAPVPRAKGLTKWSPAMMANFYHFQFLKTLVLRTKSDRGMPLSSLLNRLRSQLQSLNRSYNPKAVVMSFDNLIVNDFKVEI